MSQDNSYHNHHFSSAGVPVDQIVDSEQIVATCSDKESLINTAMPSHPHACSQFDSTSADEDDHGHSSISKMLAIETLEESDQESIDTHLLESDGEKPSHKDPKGNSLSIEALQHQLESASNSEAKLNISLDFMEKILAQRGTLHFRLFWDVRKMCGDFFKEEIDQATRLHLWKRYSEVSKEMRRLKEILDEQSAFAVEQIEIAIQSLETDVTQFEESVGKLPFPNFSDPGHVLKGKLEFYAPLQRELNLLNAQASRISALRKGLIKTEMRIRHKNQFFQRLSTIGDKVFPLRKERIKTISQHFVTDIDRFITEYLADDTSFDSLAFLREEIKALQAMAKILTLNTQAFTHTRTHLSESWDKIRCIEKERKKERSQQKVIFKQNREVLEKDIEEFSKAFQEGSISLPLAQKKLDEITQFIRNTELGRDELKYLQTLLQNARKLIFEKNKLDEQLRQEQEDSKIRLRKEKVTQLKQRIDTLMHSEDLDFERLINERDALQEEIYHLSIPKIEKQELERLLKPLRDVINDKKEQALLALSDDDRDTLQQLHQVLKQRKERRQEIKNQLELYRKSSSGSGLDFEQAIAYNAQIKAEKERLEKINEGIIEVEARIAELEDKVS